MSAKFEFRILKPLEQSIPSKLNGEKIKEVERVIKKVAKKRHMTGPPLLLKVVNVAKGKRSTEFIRRINETVMGVTPDYFKEVPKVGKVEPS